MHTLFCGFGIFIFLSILFGERKFCEVKVVWNYLPDFIAAFDADSKRGNFRFPKRPIRTSGCLFYDIHDHLAATPLYRVRQ